MAHDVPGEHQEGDTADAIRAAEVALAHQNSVTAQVDLQVVVAVLNAHLKAAASRESLDALQRDIEGAVASRSDLDTPAGARDFQRYLIGKLRDIQAVVAGANLDDTSNSALMAAWTSLYNASKLTSEELDGHPPAPPSTAGPTQKLPAATEPDPDPYADFLPDDQFGMPPDEPAGSYPAGAAPASSAVPSIPSFGGGGMPGAGGGLGMPTGLPLPPAGMSEELSPNDFDDPSADFDDAANRMTTDGEGHEEPDEPASGPTTVTLPNGETLTAASPQIAAVIEAAASGTPIADAFRQEGITIPPPGTAVSEPVRPSDLTPGDIGMFVDKHALSLGPSKALVNGQIQHISTVSGPGFLGWEHPPVPVPSEPDRPPAPTRPATTRTIETT